MHDKSAVLILEAPWNIYEGDVNRSSVEPFFQGLAKQSNDIEILHSRFYDVSSFRLAFAALSKHKYKNAIVYVAGHGDGQRVGGAKIVDIMAEDGIIASKSEGRRLVQQGGLLLGEAKVTDLDAVLTAQDFTDGSVLLRKGKKSYFRLVLE